ncbi:MAG: BlaI/MecI/CopY family transcriptional regulator [Methanobacteriota archaeon]
MELGDLELAVLAAVRSLGEATPGDIHREVRRTRGVAYTSVTTTLYRLVGKDLVATRRASEKRVSYRIKEGRAYRLALARMVGSLLDSFGPAAVSHVLERPDALTDEQRRILEARIAERRRTE